MAVVAFVRPAPGLAPEFCLQAAERAGAARVDAAEKRLRVYGRAMRLCFIMVLAMWAAWQTGCLLSLFLHFQSGIVAGTIDGTLAFRLSPFIDYFSPPHALSSAFAPHVFPVRTSALYAGILMIASVPFCVALLCLARLFDLYAHGEIFSQHTAKLIRRIGHAIMATGYSPLLLGPFAHAIGVLRPISGMTSGMIACLLAGLMLLAISHVMEIGQQMRQDQEDII
jgi:hypothetical protein